MRTLSYHAVVLGLLLLLLSGCGFKLRGQAQLPPEMATTYLKTNRPAGSSPSELALTLERVLKANGVTVTTDPAAATATLEILQEGVSRRTIAAGTTISTGQTTAQIREFTLKYDVNYRVTLANGKVLIPQATASVSRDMVYNEARVLGKEAGEEILLRDMASDLARSIIRRLQAATP